MKNSGSDRQKTSPTPEGDAPRAQDGLDFEMVRRHEEQFDPKQWERAMEHKRQMPRRVSSGTPDPGPAVLQKLKAKDVGIFIGNRNHKASVRASRNPQKNGSFGFVGAVATVAANAPFLDGILVLRFNQKKLGLVNRESLRIFRWDEKAKRFFKVPGSSVGLDGDYVYARINRAGRYSIIGVNTHPTVLQTVKAFHGIRDLLKGVPPDLADAIRDRLCRVLLCDSGIAQQLRAPNLFRELVRAGASDGFPMPSGDTGTLTTDSILCDFCFGVPGLPPEEQIFEEMLPTGSGCSEMPWQSVGPTNMSGCIRQIALDPNNSNRLYAAAADGGVWVLDQIDSYPFFTWRPLTDQEDDLRTHAMAIAPSDSRIIYYTNRLGYLYKSTDRGERWSRTSDFNFGDYYVKKILVHPLVPQIVLVASQTGLHISIDGGESWRTERFGEQLLDAAMDPLDPSIVYVASRNRGVYKNYTLGFGTPWDEILPWSTRTRDPNPDDPSRDITNMIKIALAYRNTDGSFQRDENRRVVVKLGREILVNDHGGLGDWTKKIMIPGTGYGDWDHCVAIDPFNPNVILAGHQDLYRTADGGNSWSAVAGAGMTHEDHQYIEFDRRNHGVVYSANDGGVFRSTDSGATWVLPGSSDPISHTADEIAARRNLNSGLVTAQFYRVGVQGNCAVGDAYHSTNLASPDLSSGRWHVLQGGNFEFAQVYADPKRPNRYYVFQSMLARQRYPLSVPLEPHGSDFLWYGLFKPYGYAIDAASGAVEGRAVEPMAVDTRRDSDTILVSARNALTPGYRLMITTEGNKEPLGPTDPPSNLPAWSVAIDTGSDPIVSVVFAHATPGKAYVMTASGEVFTKDDVNIGIGWVRPGRWSTAAGGVRQFAVDADNDGLLYAITGNQFSRSEDGGATWRYNGDGASPPLGVNLPTSEFNSIVTHPWDTFKLYLGAESGVCISRDKGETWDYFEDGLPNAEVTQIFWHGIFLYAVTHGRGLWRCRPC